MKTPPYLLSAALMFWGWQTGLWLFAAIIAIILEGSRFVKFRWELSFADFKRVSDLCSLILIGTLVYLFVSQNPIDITFILLQWLPLLLFPLLAAQYYSTNGTVDLRALFLTRRRKQKTADKKPPITIDLSYPYLILCILAAAAANTRKTNQFYLGLFLLAAWALWSVRSKRYSPVVWGSVLIMAGIIGYAGHIQLHQFQRSLEESETFLRLFGGVPQDADPYQSITAIGDIGTVKLSNRVIFRVKSDTGHQSPLLLREASYNTYTTSKWYAARSKFTAIQPETGGTTWKIYDPPLAPPGTGIRSQEGRVTVSSYLTDGKGLLKLPIETFQIEDLLVLTLLSNQYGALKVEEGPRLIMYQAVSGQHGAVDSSPDETDVFVAPDELPVITQLIEKLHLTSTSSPNEILQKVSAFFQGNFSYSLELQRQVRNSPPLVDFLLNARTGHCEYFATATVLLLRAAGIPARYAAGYSVDGLEKQGEWIVVRGRHAHAWTLVYLNGAWHNFDTTPPSWRQIENDAASPFEYISDLWSRWKFALTEWRQREGDDAITRYLRWLLIPLFLVLGWRLYSKKRVKRVKEGQPQQAEIAHHPGVDSEFYLIEKRLQESGFVRHPWEPLSHWIRRIEKQSSAPSLRSLHPILTLHYRYRFDPEGITPDEKAILTSSVHSWLQQHEPEHFR